MKKLLVSTVMLAGLMGAASVSHAAECGQVSIASMNWQSAEVMSNVDKFILGKGYGCRAEITIGDTVPTITSMAEKGQPDIAPEAWVDLVPEVVKRGFDEGRIVRAAASLPDGGVMGWWIPKYIADAHPEIKTVGDALKNPKLFPDPNDSSRGAILNGPQGWGGTVVTAQLFKALKADKAGFNLIDTGSAAGLDGAISKGYERKKGFIAFYWAPTSLLGRYEMVRLVPDEKHDAAEWKRCNTVADCPDPKPNAWPTDHVFTLVSKPFSERVGPDVMDYLSKRAWSNDTVSKLMAWMTDNQASGEEGAVHFLKKNPDIWTKWVTPDVAKKVKAAL